MFCYTFTLVSKKKTVPLATKCKKHPTTQQINKPSNKKPPKLTERFLSLLKYGPLAFMRSNLFTQLWPWLKARMSHFFFFLNTLLWYWKCNFNTSQKGSFHFCITTSYFTPSIHQKNKHLVKGWNMENKKEATIIDVLSMRFASNSPKPPQKPLENAEQFLMSSCWGQAFVPSAWWISPVSANNYLLHLEIK